MKTKIVDGGETSKPPREERRWRRGDPKAPKHVKRIFQAPMKRDAGGARGSITLPLQRAPTTIERGMVYPDERAIEIPVSNGDPLQRQFYGLVYEEILVHSHDGVDLQQFASSNAMMLRDHDARRPCGRIERAYLNDNRLWVRAVFPENAGGLVEETWLGLAADLYRNVSVGWNANPDNVEVIENPRDAPDLDFRVIYHEWSPMEASIVSVPADWSVGVGRDLTVPITRTDTMPEWLKKLLERYASQISQRGRSVNDLGDQMVRDGVGDEGAATDYLLNYFAPPQDTRPAEPEPRSRPSVPSVGDPERGGSPAEPQPGAASAASRNGSGDPRNGSAGSRNGGPENLEPQRQPEPPAPQVDPSEGLRVLLDSEQMVIRNGLDARTFRNLQRSAIENRWTGDQARLAVLGALETGNPSVRQPAGPAVIAEMGERYNVTRGLQMLAAGRGSDMTIPEMAVSAERQRHWQRQLAPNEMFMPIRELQRSPDFIRYMHRELQKRLREARMMGDSHTVERMETQPGLGLGEMGGQRDITVGPTPNGLWVPDFDELAFIEVLVAQTGILPLTDTWPEMLYQDLKIPAETGPAATAWTTDEATAIPKTTSPTYGNIEWTWHEIHATFDVSRKSQDQSMTLMMRLVQAIMRDIPRGIGLAMFTGTGSGGVPLGIQNFTGIDNIALGALGGPPDYGFVVDLYTAIGDNNALDLGMPVYFFNATTIGTLRKTPKFAGSQGSIGSNSDTIIVNPTGGMPMIDGSTPVVMDNQLPSNLTKSTATNLSMGVICVPMEFRKAYFSDLVIGIDEFTDWRTGQIRYYVRHACDFQPLHVGAFALSTDIVNA